MGGNLQSERKSERPKTNPMYDVPMASKENTSIIGYMKQKHCMHRVKSTSKKKSSLSIRNQL